MAFSLSGDYESLKDETAADFAGRESLNHDSATYRKQFRARSRLRGDRSKPVWAVFIAAGAPLAQYPSRLLTMFFKGSPFSNLPYCFRKKRIA